MPAGRLVAAVPADRWDAATPCAEWTVRDLVQHLVDGTGQVAAALAGATAPQRPDGPADPAGADAGAVVGSDEGSPGSDEGGDLAERYRAAESAMLAAFAAPGAMERLVTVPLGTVPADVALHLRTVEALVHGWDLAVAAQQPVALPDDLAEQELAFARGALAQLPPGRRPFGPPQPVREDAPAIERLVALLGRSVPHRSLPGGPLPGSST